MNQLDVINACLATMGERPLNDINEPHPMRFAAKQLLYTENRRRQALGRWYNMENITLAPGAVGGHVYLPGDTLSFRTDSRNTVIRGRALYDLDAGTPVFTESVKGTLIRLVPFDDLPESAAQYIATETVLMFQMKYDGDSTKTRQLAQDRDDAKMTENVDHIRNRKSNFITSNTTLQRLKSITRRARATIYQL